MKNRYSKKELDKFEAIIRDKIAQAEIDLRSLQSCQSNPNGTDNTYKPFKSFEEGSETFSKEQITQLILREEKYIRDLKNALIRIRNKTYGICRVTGNLIPKERMILVPHATLSVEGKNRIEHEQHKHVAKF